MWLDLSFKKQLKFIAYTHETSGLVSNSSSNIGIVVLFLNSSDNHSPISNFIPQLRRLVTYRTSSLAKQLTQLCPLSEPRSSPPGFYHHLRFMYSINLLISNLRPTLVRNY